MCAPCAASSSASRRCTAAYAASSYSPRPIPDWLVTITTNQPAWVRRRQPRGQDVRRQMVRRQLNQPRLEGLAWERSAADFRFSLDYIRTFAHALVQRFCPSTYLRDVFSKHTEDRYLATGGLRISV